MAAKDSFVSKLVKDPSRPPETVLMSGYPGESSEQGHERLYTDPELSQWVDVPKDAVLHTEDMRGDSGLPGVMMWISREFVEKLRFRTPIHHHFPRTVLQPLCPPPPTPHPAFCLTPSSPACPPITPSSPVCGQVTRSGPLCPITVTGPQCFTPSSPFCPPQTQAGPFCQFTPGGGGMLTLSCPSAVDACPSAPGGCDWFTPQINPQITPQITPGLGGWGGGFQGGGFQGGGFQGGGFGFGR